MHLLLNVFLNKLSSIYYEILGQFEKKILANLLDIKVEHN